jgi:hypothetical protein
MPELELQALLYIAQRQFVGMVEKTSRATSESQSSSQL